MTRAKRTFGEVSALPSGRYRARYTGPDGKRREYTSTDAKLPPEKLAAMKRHVMDCMDCHNRPTHIFQTPDGAVDRALASGQIPRNLPWFKKVAVDALVRPYPTRAAADAGLRAEILGFYEKNYPAVSSGRKGDLEAAVQRVVDIYGRSVFPAMKVNWTTYASNIGHRNWPGCFRCHDGKHVTAGGKVLTRECTACHTMPQRGPLTPIGTSLPASPENWHPWELKGKHAVILCNRCHAAGFRAPSGCAECHKLDTKAPMMDGGCDTCHAAEQQVKPLNDCKGCHDTLPGLHNKGGHPDATCTDCHKPHVWKVTGRDTCLACHDDKVNHHKDGGACASCHDFKTDSGGNAPATPAAAAAHGA